MLLYLIRHGAADTGGRLAGHVDYPLSKEGLGQAAALARHFQKEPLTRLFSSPLQRARSTAETLSSVTGLGVEVWPELMERSGGLFSGRTTGYTLVSLSVDRRACLLEHNAVKHLSL